jgi:hypothetical protein
VVTSKKLVVKIVEKIMTSEGRCGQKAGVEKATSKQNKPLHSMFIAGPGLWG